MRKLKASQKNDAKAPDTYYAVVRVRGTPDIRKEIRESLSLIGLKKPNHCIIIPKTPSYDGMIKKIKDYVTWGEVSKEFADKLLKNAETDKLVRLHPPKKGHGKKGIKLAFKQGGSLGYRGEKISELIEQMTC